MSGRSGGSEGPEDVDAAFAEIIADLEREGLGAGLTGLTGLTDERTTPADPPDRPSTRRREESEPGSASEPSTGPLPELPDLGTGRDWRASDAADVGDLSNVSDVEWDWSEAGEPVADEEEHYVPPEPPPLPRLRPSTVFGIVLLVIGIFLLVAPTVIGLSARIATPLALISLAAGIGWLVLRMRQGPPPDSGWDDGAQL